MLQVGKKRSDVVWIISDIIFPTSYVVFPTPNVVFGAFGKSRQFWLCRNHSNGVCCLLIAYGIYVGAYGIRPYGGSGYAETQCMPRELEMREM